MENDNSPVDQHRLSENFVCFKCGIKFANRDTLAMHMMESVSNDGCSKIKAKQHDPSNSGSIQSRELGEGMALASMITSVLSSMSQSADKSSSFSLTKLDKWYDLRKSIGNFLWEEEQNKYNKVADRVLEQSCREPSDLSANTSVDREENLGTHHRRTILNAENMRKFNDRLMPASNEPSNSVSQIYPHTKSSQNSSVSGQLSNNGELTEAIRQIDGVMNSDNFSKTCFVSPESDNTRSQSVPPNSSQRNQTSSTNSSVDNMECNYKGTSNNEQDEDLQLSVEESMNCNNWIPESDQTDTKRSAHRRSLYTASLYHWHSRHPYPLKPYNFSKATQQSRDSTSNLSTSANDNSKYSTDMRSSPSTHGGKIYIFKSQYVCSHCQILFKNQLLYNLHMGLHCVDQPWKCNMCGKVCSGLYEFTVHSLHF